MLEELRDLALKKSKAEKAVHEFKTKKEEEKIRKGLQSTKLKEFFEPVTTAIEKKPETQNLALPPTAPLIPIQNIMDQPIPIEPPPPIVTPPIEGAEGGEEIKVVEQDPSGINLDQYDAENKFTNPTYSAYDKETKIEEAKRFNRALGTIRKGAKEQDIFDQLIEKNRKYYQTLQGKTGKGLAAKGSYKVDSSGSFSDLLLDLEQLLDFNRLYGLDKTGNRVVDEKVDDDFIDLVTKRYNPKKKYSDLAKRTFTNLVTLSSHPLVKTSGKYKHILCDNPDKLVDRLELIVASLESGNNSNDLLNEGMSILDTLLQNKEITGEQHELLFRKYFD